MEKTDAGLGRLEKGFFRRFGGSGRGDEAFDVEAGPLGVHLKGKLGEEKGIGEGTRAVWLVFPRDRGDFMVEIA